MSQPNQKLLGQKILAKCATCENPLKRGSCALRLSAHNVDLVLDMDKNPIKSKLEDKGKRCDFAAYQRVNPLNHQAHLVLMEFKDKLHNVNEVLQQLGASLAFLECLSTLSNFAFDRRMSVLVCAKDVGPRKTRRLMEAQVICMGVATCLRPLVLVGEQELTDEQIAEYGQPRPKTARKKRKG